MASPASSPQGFNHPRSYPDLPPGYDWETQIKKYCPHNLTTTLMGDRSKKPHKHGYVFCHRGLYDRAMKIPENSHWAIDNGIQKGLMLHEVDARLARPPADSPTAFDGFLAHDEVANRITSKDGRWSSINISVIRNTTIVTRRVGLGKGGLASYADSWQETDQKVPLLDSVVSPSSGVKNLNVFTYEDFDGDGRCLQLDLRGNDLLRALVFYNNRRVIDVRKIILKGYSSEFASAKDLDAAAASLARRQQETYAYMNDFLWREFPYGPHIIMVFYSKPLMTLALRISGLDPARVPLADRLRFSFQKLRDTLVDQVSSFVEFYGFAKNISFIPEIVHSGLGLGYNVESGRAVNPWNGDAIEDDEVLLEGRIDRAMIEASLKLRGKYPELRFSSCTRLCDVWTSAGELMTDIHTGKLKPKPGGEHGISTQLRGVHGGLYPQSDLVVADDPLAEIAARTWIDEYDDKLDRRDLLTLSYSTWLAGARPETIAAITRLNGPFLPNKWEGSLDEEKNILEEVLGDDAKGEDGVEDGVSSAGRTNDGDEEDEDDEDGSHDQDEDHEEDDDVEGGDEGDTTKGNEESDDDTVGLDSLDDPWAEEYALAEEYLKEVKFLKTRAIPLVEEYPKEAELVKIRAIALAAKLAKMRAVTPVQEDLNFETIWSVDSSEDDELCQD